MDTLYKFQCYLVFNFRSTRNNTIFDFQDEHEQPPLFILADNWSDNEIDSTLSRRRRDAARVVNLQGDTRVNQILSEKQKSSGLYSIDPDAELLDDNYFYEVEGRRPTKQQVFYRQNQVRPVANYQTQYADNGQQVARRPPQQYQGRPNYQQQQVRPPRYNNFNKVDDYQRSLPVTSDDTQRILPFPSDIYQVTIPNTPDSYQRSAPFSSSVYTNNQQSLPQNTAYIRPDIIRPEGKVYEETLTTNTASVRGDLISPEADDYQRALPIPSQLDLQELQVADKTGNKLPVDYQRQQVLHG